MLTLDNVSCRRQDKWLFNHLGVTIGDCCLLTIKGDNGSGKTSLLKIMAGLLPPDEGEVLYANESIIGEYYAEYCDIIHYIGHKPAVKLTLTVEENLRFWASIYGNEAELLEPAIHFFGLDQVRDIELARLSMGWQKRVILAKLLLRKAEIWLLDEPYTFLDEKGKYLLNGLIRARVEQGGSVVIASNDDIGLTDGYELHLKDF